MMIRILVGALGVVLLLAGPAGAQSRATSTVTFDSLSPGNQKIAQALFSAQGTTGTPLTRDQIAALKGTEGWGRVFQQMKADGLIQAKNLGQVVSQHEHQLHASTTTSTTGRTASTATGATRAAAVRGTHSGGSWGGTRFASTRWRGSAGFASGRSIAAPHMMGGGFGPSAMGGFGHAGMGGGFAGGGFAGGFAGGHGGGHGR
jgi:hypothetical protein